MELSRPGALLDFAFNPRMVSSVTSVPAYKFLAAQPQFLQVQGAIDLLQVRLGTDWKTGLRKILAGGYTLAVDTKGASYLIVEAESNRILRDLNEFALNLAGSKAVAGGRGTRVETREYRGITGWTIGPNEAHAILGNRLLLSNRPEALETMMELREGPGEGTLAELPEYRAARKAVDGAAASLFVNLKFLKQNPNFQNGLRQNQNPMAALLLGSFTEALLRSNWLALGLSVKGDSLRLEARTDSREAVTSGAAAFSCPDGPGRGALPNISIPGRIAAISFYRDLPAFYRKKDTLFPERTSGLIFFENMMGIFFRGRDFTEEVLAETGPEIRFVVAKQSYDPDVGTPQTQFPSFAAVLRLNHPETFSGVMEEAWQTAVGMINFTQGQQAHPGMVIDRPVHDGTKFTTANFRPPVEKKKEVGSIYNFSPSLAILGKNLILSSTEELTRNIMDALKGEARDAIQPLARTHSLLELDGIELLSILKANAENLIRSNMLKKGSTREAAKGEIGLLFDVLEFLGGVRVDAGKKDDRPRLSLELKLNVPAAGNLK